MSDHIPFDLQVEIIKRVPTKSILKFRAVSKPWKSLIDSAKFIADYNHQSQNLIISYGYYRRDAYGYGEHFSPTYVKIEDDDTFPQHKISLTVPSYNFNVNMLEVISCSHGLFCFIGRDPGTRVYRAIIWNPSIRKSVQIDVPNLHRSACCGFGVCSDTNDPKFVEVNKIGTKKCSYEVEVYTLSSGLWRRRPLSKLPNKFFQHVWDDPLVIDGFMYWFSLYNGVYMIISFHLTSEEFNHVYLPNKVAFTNDTYLHAPMYKLRESLVVVKSQIKAHKQVYTAWMMDDSVSKSFKKIFTINLPYSILKERRILGFRKNGELLMEEQDYKKQVTFVAYEPGSKYTKRLGISGDSGLCFAGSYEESLLLLDQPETLTDFNSNPRVK